MQTGVRKYNAHEGNTRWANKEFYRFQPKIFFFFFGKDFGNRSMLFIEQENVVAIHHAYLFKI